MRGDSSGFEKIGQNMAKTITDALGQFLAEQLNGELTTSTAYDSTGYEWRKITIVYDKKKREYGEPVKKVSQSRVGKDLDLI